MNYITNKKGRNLNNFAKFPLLPSESYSFLQLKLTKNSLYMKKTRSLQQVSNVTIPAQVTETPSGSFIGVAPDLNATQPKPIPVPIPTNNSATNQTVSTSVVPGNMTGITTENATRITTGNATGNATTVNPPKLLPGGNITTGNITSNITGNLPEKNSIEVNQTFAGLNETASSNQTTVDKLPQKATGVNETIIEKNITSPKGPLNITEKNMTNTQDLGNVTKIGNATTVVNASFLQLDYYYPSFLK